MSISKDLLLSILSLDAYNQGYDRGLEHGKTKIGSAEFKFDDTSDQAQNVGFYAVSYDVDASGVEGLEQDITVISYRGTDFPPENSTTGSNI
jgi:hypothetical protein